MATTFENELAPCAIEHLLLLLERDIPAPGLVAPPQCLDLGRFAGNNARFFLNSPFVQSHDGAPIPRLQLHDAPVLLIIDAAPVDSAYKDEGAHRFVEHANSPILADDIRSHRVALEVGQYPIHGPATSPPPIQPGASPSLKGYQSPLEEDEVELVWKHPADRLHLEEASCRPAWPIFV